MRTPQVKEGRRANGSIQKGSRPKGGGRPPMHVEKEYLKATIQTVSLEDWKRIADIALRDALNGDWRARDWLTKYILGNRPLSASEALSELPPAIIR